MKTIKAISIAGLYAALVLALPGISYGPLQIRIADILSPLPYIMGFESVVGLTLGTLIANILSPYGIWDMAIGTLCNLTYAVVCWILGRKIGYKLWMLPVITMINSLIVGLYIGYLLLGTIAFAGEPTTMFALITVESLIPMGIGSLVLVPIVRRYLRG